jgi:hypothetical protein
MSDEVSQRRQRAQSFAGVTRGSPLLGIRRHCAPLLARRDLTPPAHIACTQTSCAPLPAAAAAAVLLCGGGAPHSQRGIGSGGGQDEGGGGRGGGGAAAVAGSGRTTGGALARAHGGSGGPCGLLKWPAAAYMYRGVLRNSKPRKLCVLAAFDFFPRG